MNVESGLQIDLIGAAKRRAPLAIALAGAVFLVVYWIAMALPNQYTSYATLLVEPQTVSDRLVEAGASETDLNERLHLMASQILSRVRLSRVIDELGLYEEESQSMPRQDVIDLMRSKVKVVPILPEFEGELSRNQRENLEINTFQIRFTADSPRKAASVAQRLANDFIEEHISGRVQITERSLEFLEAEQTRLSGAIQRLNEQIAEVKSENPGRLPEDLPANRRLAERAIGDLREAQRQLDSAQSDRAFWRNQKLAAVGESRDETSPERRLQMLELQLAEFRAKGFTDKHPDLIRVSQEIDELRDTIERTDGEEEADAPKTLAQQSAEAEERRAALRVQSSQEEVARLEQQLAEIQARIEGTPRVAERLAALEQRRDQLVAAARDFAQRRQEASVQADLERRQLGEQFRVLEAAFPPTEPSAPNRILLLAIGAMAGIAVGGGIGLLLESTDTSVHGARELQSSMGIPVLASIPAIFLESDRARQRRRRIQLGLAAAAVTLFCLVGGAATYYVVNGAPGGDGASAEEIEQRGAGVRDADPRTHG